MTDEEHEALCAKLRPRLTNEFLATLVEAARIDGHSTDWVELKGFLQNVFDIAGKEAPDIEPYE